MTEVPRYLGHDAVLREDLRGPLTILEGADAARLAGCTMIQRSGCLPAYQWQVVTRGPS